VNSPKQLSPAVSAGGRDLLVRVGILAVVIVAFSIVIRGFVSVNNVYSILQVTAPIGIAAIGVGVTMLAGEFDLSIGSNAVLGGVMAVSLAPVSPLAGVLAAIAVGIVLGGLQGQLISRLRISSLVITVGSGILIRGIAYLITGDSSKALTSFDFGHALNTRLGPLSPFSILLVLAVAVVWAYLRYTKSGRELLAVGGGRREAIAAGIPARRPITLAFAFSGAMGALSGALVSFSVGGVTPTGFTDTLLSAVAASVIGGIALSGGKGSPWGILIGAVALGVVSSGVSVLGAPVYVSQLLSAGLLLIALVAEMFMRPRRRPRAS
jgi:ribose transport system permease protein